MLPSSLMSEYRGIITEKRTAKQKPRVITPGLFAAKPVNPEPDLPSNSIVPPKEKIVKDTLVSGPTEGGGVEPQWLMEPLTDLTGRVQYPLPTPSRQRPAQTKLLLGLT